MHVATPSGRFKYECLLRSPEKHPLNMCAKFNKFTVNQRQEHLKTNHLCHNCLTPGHNTTECRSPARCKVCEAKHHTMVHKDVTSLAQTVVATIALAPQSPSIPDILMMTSQVTLTEPGRKTFLARALLDSGSSMTLASSRAAQALSLPVTKTRVTFSGVQDTPIQSSNALVILSISPSQVIYPQLEISTAVVSKVTCNLPLQGASSLRDLSHLQDLELADHTFHQPGRIDLLLGGDILPQIILPQSRAGPRNTPTAWNTIFDWVLLGPFQSSSNQRPSAVSTFNQFHKAEPTDQLLYQFREIEEPSLPAEAFTPEEEKVQHHFLNTFNYLPSVCRYRVTLPRKTGIPPLGDSRSQALQRYRSNERAILRKNTWESFRAIVQGNLYLGHAEPVSPYSLVSTK